MSLPPASGYVCCGCKQPTSKTLTLTNKWGSATLTWSGASSSWKGNQVISVEACTEYCCECQQAGGNFVPSVKTTAAGPVTIEWEFVCARLGGVFKSVNYAPIGCGGNCDNTGVIFAADTIARATEGCCNDPKTCTLFGGAAVGVPDEVVKNCEGVISYSWAEVRFTTGDTTSAVVSE